MHIGVIWEKRKANRNMRLMNVEPDGSKFQLYVSPTMQIDMDAFWSPRELHDTIVENIGYPTPTSMIYGKDIYLKEKTMLACWAASSEWQAASLNYLMENGGYKVVFSHFHNVDLQGHTYLTYIPDGTEKITEEEYLEFSKKIYITYKDSGWNNL